MHQAETEICSILPKMKNQSTGFNADVRAIAKNVLA